MLTSPGLRALVVALFSLTSGVQAKLDPPNLATKVLYAHIGDDPMKWEVLTAFKRGASRAMRVKIRSSFTKKILRPYYCSMVQRRPPEGSTIAATICTKPGGKAADKRSVYFHFPTHEDAVEFAELWGNVRRYKTPVELTKEIPDDQQVREEWEAVLNRTRSKVVEADGVVNFAGPVKYVRIGSDGDKFVATHAYRDEKAGVRLLKLVERKANLWDMQETFYCDDIVSKPWGAFIDAKCARPEEPKIKFLFVLHFDTQSDAVYFAESWGAPFAVGSVEALKKGRTSAALESSYRATSDASAGGGIAPPRLESETGNTEDSSAASTLDPSADGSSGEASTSGSEAVADEAPETEVPEESGGMLDERSTESEGEVTPEGNEDDNGSERVEEGTSIAGNQQDEPAGVEATDDTPDEVSSESGDSEDVVTPEGSEDDVSGAGKKEETSEDLESNSAADWQDGPTGIEATDDTPDESSSGDEEDQAGDEDTAGEGSDDQTSEDNRGGGAAEGYSEGDEDEPKGDDDDEGTEEPKDDSNTVGDSSEEGPSFEGFEDTPPPNDEGDSIDQPSSTSAWWSSSGNYPEAPLPPTFPATDESVSAEVEGEEGHGERVLDRDDDELEESLTEGSRYDDQAPEEAAAEPEASSLRGYNSDTGDQEEQEEDGVPEDLPGFEDADEVHHLARLSSGLEEGFSPGDEESSGHGEPEVRRFSEDNRVDRYKTSFDDEAHSSDELEADTAAVEEGGEDKRALDSSEEEHSTE
ncbi:hypothetical protein FOZ62_000520, partial [Perkinsus olseni]